MIVRLESPLYPMDRLSLRLLFNIDKVTAPLAQLSTLPKAEDEPFWCSFRAILSAISLEVS
jgi:hypothetical protein